MDQNKLRTLVFEKTGIKIDTTDPVFAVVALNEAVLSEYVDRHINVMNEVTERVGMQTNQLLEASERYRKLLHHIGDAAAIGNAPEVAAILEAEKSAASDQYTSGSQKPIDWRWIAAAGAVAFLTATLTLGGQWAFGRQEKPPAMQPTQVIQTPLTPDLILKIQDGEKYAKMWPKLDAKTQDRIRALIQQP